MDEPNKESSEKKPRERFLALFEEAKRAEQRGDLRKAIACLSDAVSVEPANPAGWLMLASFQMDDKEYEAAIASFKRVIEIGGEGSSAGIFASGYGGLGRALFELERWEQAVATLRKSIKLRPRAEPYVFLGIAHEKLGDESAAEASYRSAIDLDPVYEEAMYNLACLLRDRDRDEAQKWFQKALKLDPEAYAEDAYYFEEGGSEKDDT